MKRRVKPPSDGSLMDHSFQLANANKNAIDSACDNLFPGEVLFKFNSLLHQLTLCGPWPHACSRAVSLLGFSGPGL